jgi:hypothetical protein
MKLILRIVLSGVFIHTLYQAAYRYETFSGIELALLMFYVLLGAIFVAVLWAPYIGAQVSEPITGSFLNETTIAPVENEVVEWIHWCEARKWRRLALMLCFLEGLRYPVLPHPALLGLRNCRPGSLLEKWFAREVFNYNNIKNCLHAYTILKERHDVTPPLHRLPEVNLAIRSLTRVRPPEASTVELKPTPFEIKLERNPSIRLFDP